MAGMQFVHGYCLGFTHSVYLICARQRCRLGSYAPTTFVFGPLISSNPQISSSGCAQCPGYAGEYVRELIRADEKRTAEERLETT